jgi:hypothetical protein
MRALVTGILSIGFFALPACGGGNGDMKPDLSAAQCASPGGPVSGAQDTHCQGDGGGIFMQLTSQSACNVAPPVNADLSDSGPEYGATMYNTSAYDDDCKYHVEYSVTPICENTDTYFTVSATYNQPGSAPLTGANTIVEVFNNTTLLPANAQSMKTVESPPGTYKIGPVQFTSGGSWTVRFHFNEMCDDYLPESPHGHAAFYLSVP